MWTTWWQSSHNTQNTNATFIDKNYCPRPNDRGRSKHVRSGGVTQCRLPQEKNGLLIGGKRHCGVLLNVKCHFANKDQS